MKGAAPDWSAMKESVSCSARMRAKGLTMVCGEEGWVGGG